MHRGSRDDHAAALMAVSYEHESLVELFRRRATLAVELLTGSLGVEVPSWSKVRVSEGDLGQVDPVETRADLVRSDRSCTEVPFWRCPGCWLAARVDELNRWRRSEGRLLSRARDESAALRSWTGTRRAVAPEDVMAGVSIDSPVVFGASQITAARYGHHLPGRFKGATATRFAATAALFVCGSWHPPQTDRPLAQVIGLLRHEEGTADGKIHRAGCSYRAE